MFGGLTVQFAVAASAALADEGYGFDGVVDGAVDRRKSVRGGLVINYIDDIKFNFQIFYY